jgi:PII-like signaling protein
MKTIDNVKVLRVYTSSTDKLKHTPMYEMIVFAARRNGMAGATVHKGVMGYGSSSVVHSAKFWETNDKLPVVVEIIDESAKIETFFEVIKPYLESVRYGCLVTIEDAHVLLYKAGGKKKVFEL